MEQTVNFNSTKSNKVVGILNDTNNYDWIVIFIHGFNSTKNHKHFLPIIEKLIENGVSTFRYDTFGQGESDGELEDLTISEAVDDALQAIEYVNNLGFKNIGLVGTSFGGFVALITAGKYNKLKFLALKSPVSDYNEQVKVVAKEEDLATWKEKGFVNYGDADQFIKLNYPFFEDMMRHDAYEIAKELTIPTLIVHGDSDTSVSISQSKKLASILTNAKLEIIHGADHGYKDPVHASTMRELIGDFVMEQISQDK